MTDDLRLLLENIRQEAARLQAQLFEHRDNYRRGLDEAELEWKLSRDNSCSEYETMTRGENVR
jgi:hypothetical protein